MHWQSQREIYILEDVWDVGFYWWIENGGLGGDWSSTFDFNESMGLRDTDISRCF